MEDAVNQAREAAKHRESQGINQAALDTIAEAGLLNAQFEYSEEEGLQVVEEFTPEGAVTSNKTQPQSSQGLSQKLAEKKTA